MWPITKFASNVPTTERVADMVAMAFREAHAGAAGPRVPREVHHVNSDPTDNRIQNTIPLCVDRHRSATFPGI